MLTRLRIKNFRSVKDAEISLGPIGVFVGPNNAGKSNILRAAGLLFDRRWPPSALTEDDKHRDGRQAPIVLEAQFHPSVPKNYYGQLFDVYGLRLTYDSPDTHEFVCLDQAGAPLLTRSGKELPVNNETRNEISTLAVDSLRDLSDELRAGQWSVLGRLLASIRDALRADAAYVAEHETRAKHLTAHVKAGPVDDLQRILNEEMRGITGFSTLSLSFDPPELIDSLKALRIRVSEKSGLPEYPAEELGQGLQSALVVGLVRAYQRLKHTRPVLLLEEPESYLHPHGRRSFFRVLRRISAGGCQVLCTTHSTEFVDLTQPDSLYIVRKEPAIGTHVTRGDPLTLTPTERDELKMATEFSPGLREIAFSSCSVLTEGPTEEGAIPEILRKCGYDCDARGIAVKSVGGKENLPYFLGVVKSLGIPCIVVFDIDSDKPDYGTYQVPLNTRITALAGGADRCWTSSPDFERANDVPTTDTSKARSGLKWAKGLDEPRSRQVGGPLVAAINRVLP